MTAEINEDFQDEEFQESTPEFEETPFCEDDAIVVRMTPSQYDCTENVINVMNNLFLEKERVRHKLSDLLLVMSIYGLRFNDEIRSKLKDSGFDVSLLDRF